MQSLDELLGFVETLGFAISFATCQPGDTSDYIHVQQVLVEGPGPSGPRYSDPPTVLRQWQLLRLRNDLYCVGWGVKLYSLTRLC